MTRFATLLIVLVFTGTPVGQVICLSWCSAHAAQMGGGCHDEVGTSTEPTVAGSGHCPAVISDVTCVRQDRVVSATASGPAWVSLPPMFVTKAPSASFVAHVNPSPPRPPVVLRA
jgi:hypothetical protein